MDGGVEVPADSGLGRAADGGVEFPVDGGLESAVADRPDWGMADSGIASSTVYGDSHNLKM